MDRFNHEHEEDSTSTTPPENTADSPLSGDKAAEEVYAPSPKKRREEHKKVVTVPIGGDGYGCRSKTEAYPPPDSWSWRKYGQKPIKGSPYPRGYYRCSTSKGCPARKQIERSRHNPTTLLITYSCDHNHTPPATKNHHHQNPPLPVAVSSMKSAINSSSSDTTSPPPPNSVANQPDIEPADNGFSELAGELGWLCDVGSTMMDGITLVGPNWVDQADVEVSMPIGEEDKLLFGDLGDLPESLVVFRHCRVETPCCAGNG